MSGEIPEQQRLQLQQNAHGLLKEALKNNRLYTNFPETLATQYTKPLVEILTEENALNAKLKAKGWLEWGKAFVKTDPDYDASNKKISELAQQKQQFIAVYVEQTRLIDASQLIRSLQLKETPELCQTIATHIKSLENIKFKMPEENVNLMNGPIIIREEEFKKQIQNLTNATTNLLKQLLINQNNAAITHLRKIDGFESFYDKYKTNPLFLQLITDFENLYIDYLSTQINVTLLKNDEELKSLYIEALKTKQQQLDFLYDKITLVYKYSQSIEYSTIDGAGVRTDQLMEDVNKTTTPDTVKRLKNIAEKAFNDTAGSYMLPGELKQKYIDKMFFIEHQKEMWQKLKQQNPDLNKEMEQKLALQTQDLSKEVTAAIEQAVKTVKIPLEMLPNIEFATTVRQNAIKHAGDMLKEIPGQDLIPEPKKIEVFNKLCLLEERELIKNKKSWWGAMPSKYKYKEEDKKIFVEQEIPKIIHDSLKENPQIKKNVETYKSLYGTDQIADQKLREKLEEQLEDSIINQKKLSRKIPPLPNTATDPTEVLDYVETANILSKIDSFKELALDRQMSYIKQIKGQLEFITKETNEITRLQDVAQNDSSIQNKISEKQRLIDSSRQTIKKTIEDISAEAFKKYRQAISQTTTDTTILERGNWFAGIKKSTSNLFTKTANSSAYNRASNGINKFKLFFKFPKVQGAITGAVVMTAIATVLATGTGIISWLTNSIPVVGPYITGLTSTFIQTAGIAVCALAGAIIGYKYPQIASILFKPCTYIYNEIADILTKPKSYIDRTFRAAVILASTTGMVIGIGLLVAAVANPFSGPVIGGVILGTLATVLVTAAAAKVANWTSKKTAKYFYGTEEPDLYKPTTEAILLLGQNNANRVSEFFKKEINIFQEKVNNSDPNTMLGQELRQRLELLNNTWKKLQHGDSSSWITLSQSLSQEKMANRQQELSRINTSDVTDSLIELISLHKSNDKQNDQLQRQRFIGPHRELLSFKEYNKVTNKSDKDIKELLTIDKLVMHKPE